MYLYKYISQQLISPGSIRHDSVEQWARDARANRCFRWAHPAYIKQKIVKNTKRTICEGKKEKLNDQQKQ
jgi:hypothetical protein